jgi:hypothetical protein
MTKHADIRSQQRGISPMMIDLLLQFGEKEPAGGGASKVYLNKSARRKLRAYAGALAPLVDQHLDIYAVVGRDNQIVTVGHRYEHIQRH